MTTLAPTSAPTDTIERGYQWYLANLDEIRHIIETDTRLNILRAIETDLGLPLGTAIRFEELYSEATNVSPHEEERYAATWTHIMPPWTMIKASPGWPMPITQKPHHQSTNVLMILAPLSTKNLTLCFRPHGLAYHRGTASQLNNFNAAAASNHHN